MWMGVRLWLWNATTNGHVVHHASDIWVSSATMEWYWEGKLKNSEENQSQCHFVHHMWIDVGANQGSAVKRPATNSLSNGTAKISLTVATRMTSYHESCPFHSTWNCRPNGFDIFIFRTTPLDRSNVHSANGVDSMQSAVGRMLNVHDVTIFQVGTPRWLVGFGRTRCIHLLGI
jgi:hypothetical protein